MRVPCIGLPFTSLRIASSGLAADGKRQIGQFSGFKGDEEALGKMMSLWSRRRPRQKSVFFEQFTHSREGVIAVIRLFVLSSTEQGIQLRSRTL